MLSLSSKKTVGLFILFLFLWHIQFPLTSSQKNFSSFMTAIADEEEEEEDEDEEDEEDEEYEKSKPSTKTIDVIQNITEYKPVTETVVTLDDSYQKDTDGDQLVDAIDPNPLIKQSEYFTDTDGDGVPNALDQH
ncbi:MAG: hypothetical protein KIH67_003930, partial [Candidatus Moranbacteria bacterium]|nr:hypothetical protein [Candidatus Moranbacteria bacterium]